MLSAEQAKRLSRQYDREREQSLETLLDAICMTIEQVTGVKPGDRLRERLHDAIQFDGIL
jgi:hypothetical protein